MSDFHPLSLFHLAREVLPGWFWLLAVLALVLLVVAVLLVIAVVGALIYLRGLDLVAACIGIPFLFLVAQAITIYVTALLAYTFNTLNFWAAAVALVILQYLRRVTNRGSH